METFSLEELEPGDFFSTPLYTETGLCLTDEPMELNAEHLQQLRDWKITTICSAQEPNAEDLDANKQARDLDLTEFTSHPRHKAVEAFHPKNPALINQVRVSYNRSRELTAEALPGLVGNEIRQAEQLEACLEPLKEALDYLSWVLPFFAFDTVHTSGSPFANYGLKTALLTMHVAQEMDFKRERVLEVGLAALFHDVGHLVDHDMKQSPFGASADPEEDPVDDHPQAGSELLSEVAGLSPNIVRALKEHHEAMNASGFPESKPGRMIHKYSKLISLTMRIISVFHIPSVRSEYPPRQALNQMLIEDREKFDPDLRRSILRGIGLHPPGCFVQLETGHHALVLKNNSDHPSAPTVKVMTDENQEPLQVPYVLTMAQDVITIEKILNANQRGYSSLDEV